MSSTEPSGDQARPSSQHVVLVPPKEPTCGLGWCVLARREECVLTHVQVHGEVTTD